MKAGNGTRLRVPTLLTVAALQINACGDADNPDPTAADTTSPTTDAESSSATLTTSATDTTSTSVSTSAATGESSSTAADSGDTGAESSDGGTTRADGTDTGGGVHCTDHPDEESCIAVEICHWTPPGYCDATCDAILDEATCSEELACIWLDESCEYNGI